MGEQKIKWACPKCGATPGNHGKGGRDRCAHNSHDNSCEGFICECPDECTADHGESLSNPCPEAHCYHCEWSGTVPVMPKGLAAWEKKALEAGWTMPEARAKELGLCRTKT